MSDDAKYLRKLAKVIEPLAEEYGFWAEADAPPKINEIAARIEALTAELAKVRAERDDWRKAAIANREEYDAVRAERDGLQKHRFTGDHSDLRLRFNRAVGDDFSGDGGWIVHTQGHAYDMEMAIARIADLEAERDGTKAAFDAAEAFIESHVADPDITEEMTLRYWEYRKHSEQMRDRANDNALLEMLKPNPPTERPAP
jgi:hypothetical protein